MIKFFAGLKSSEVALCALAALVLKAVYVPRTSLLGNVVHLAHKLLQIFQTPMHRIKETDAAGIARHRAIYSTVNAMEPTYKTERETMRLLAAEGHIIDIELHRPLNSRDRKMPLVIFFHGGGFVIGNPQMYRHVMTAVASFADVVVAGVTYRLAPEHKFPCGTEDCLEATRWLVASAAELGFDAEQVAVLGDSAGGNLTATVAAELRDVIKLSIPVYPCISFSSLSPSAVENSDGILLSSSTKMWFDLMHLGPFNSHLLNHPLLCPTSRGPIESPETFPVTHVITAELDMLRDEGIYYVDYLSKNNVAVTHKMYKNTPHGFFGSSVLLHGREALFDVIEIIKQHFGRSVDISL